MSRLRYPTPRLCAWISGGILTSLAVFYTVSWAMDHESPLPDGLLQIFMCVAIIFGTGAFMTGPLVEALRLGRRLPDPDDD